MKKLFTLTLAVLLALSLAACGGSGGSSNGTTSTPGGDTGDVPDLGAIIGGTGKLTDYDAATRQAMIDAAREDGGNLEFKADGSVVFTDADGSKTIQNPDGTWTYQDAEGNSGQFGGEWPENEFTKLVPKPDFTLLGANTTANDFTVAFSNASIEQVKAYVEKLKTAGFTVDAELEDQEVMGMVIYLYSAKNTDGYGVEVSSAAGVAGLTITKL